MEDVSVLAPLRLESLGVEFSIPESLNCRLWVELWSRESEDEQPANPAGRWMLRGNRSLFKGGVAGVSSGWYSTFAF